MHREMHILMIPVTSINQSDRSKSSPVRQTFNTDSASEALDASTYARKIWFITIPKMHYAVATSFSLLTTDRMNLRIKRHRKCHEPEPVGIFYTVWYVDLFNL